MPSRFLNNININDEYSFPATDGSADQIIQTDGSGNLTFVDPSVLSVGESEQVHIACKNTSGVAISKGDPVYITGTVGTSFIIQIAAADASNSAKMPAVGLAETDLANNAEGFVIVSGVLKNLTTDPLSTSDGTPSSNDTVYVKAGGGLTRTKPTGSGNLIQNVGKVGRVNSANAGSLAVSTIMRTNDVPNLTTGKIWVGSSTYTTESTVVHLDETNSYMGVGTNNPSATIDVTGSGMGAKIHSAQTVGLQVSGGGNSQDIARFQNVSGSTKVTIDHAGNVGIGTTSPEDLLHISADSPVLRLTNTVDSGKSSIEFWDNQSGTSQAGEIFYDDNSNLFGLQGNGNGIVFRANNTFPGSELMRLNGSGNLGIGTTSPNHKLDVDGGAQFNTNTGTTPFYITRLGGTSQALSIKVMDDNVRFESIQDEAADNYGGFDFRMDGGTTEPDFVVRKNAGDPILNVKGNGNVGIGTTSPSYALDVKKDATSILNLYRPNSSTAASTNLDFSFNTADASQAIYARIIADVETNTDSAQGGDLSFHTANAGTISEVMRLTEGGNVGIGNTSPAQKLHVDGSIRVGDTNDVVYADKFFTVSNANLHIGANNGYDTIFFNGPADERMRITSTGNVGIGTTSPSQKLQVNGIGEFAGALRITETSTSQNILIGNQDSSGTNTPAMINGVNGVLRFGKGNSWSGEGGTFTEAMRVNTSGNVGIGTTGPSYKLDLRGDLRVDNGDLGGTSGDEVTHAKIHGQRHFLEFKEVRTANGTDWKDTTYKLQAGVDATDHQSIDFVADGSYQEHIDIRTGNQLFNTRFTSSGNVGIGTTSPSQKLDVAGDATFSGRIYTNTGALASVGILGKAIANGWAARYDSNNANYSGFYFDTNNDASMVLRDDAGNMNVYLRSDSTSYLNGGNVGIGTASPGYKLDVAGTGRFTSYLSFNNQGYIRGDSSGELRLQGGTTATTFYNSSNSSELMRITQAGNVGIGDTNPDAKLTVFRTDSTYAVNLSDTESRAGLSVKSSSNFDSKLTISSGASSRQYIQAVNNAATTGRDIAINPYGGNVAIGTTSPAYKLDVDGEVRVGDNQKLKLWDDPFGAIITPLNAHLALTTTRTQDNIYFDPGNSTKMIIEGGGNVGIGATSPSTKLHVLGTSSSMPSLGAAPTAAQIGGSSYGTLFSTLTSGRGVIQQGRSDGTALSFDLLLQPVGGNVAIGKTSAGVKLDVAGDVRVNGLDNFLYTTNTNDIYTFSSSTQTMANAPNGYLWHDLLAFNYVYTTTQEVTSDGTNWSSTTLQKDLFAQKEGQAITVIGSTQTGVRWTFNNTAWGSAVLLNVAFTYVASDINKNILVESSSNGTSWTTRFTNTATAGTSTKTCKLTSYGGDSYVRVTITKAVSSSNLVRMSQLRLMTLRAGDQGYGREYHLPITWDGDRNIGIKLASPTTSISEALEVNGSVKATADTDAYKGYIKSVITTGYSMKSASTLYQYIPYNSYTLTTLQAYYNRTVAAYNGRVKKIIVKRIDGASADATGMKFKKEVNGTVSTTEYTATVLSGSGNFQATYNFGNNDFTFSAGDSIGVLMQSSGGTGMIGAGAIQIVLEYNIT